MANINAFTGVGVAGMSRTLHVAEAADAAVTHPAFWAHAAAGPAVKDPWPIFLGNHSDLRIPGHGSIRRQMADENQPGSRGTSHVDGDERLREER
jgi:hypothetical protein